jgi:hypothetical protein
MMSSGPYLYNARKETHVEIYNITIQRICNSSLVVKICKWAVKFIVDNRIIINYKALQLYLQ